MAKNLYQNLLSSDAVVPVSRLVLKMLGGDYHAAALLSQCIYWSKRTKDADGWFAKTHQEWHEELALTRKHLERAVKRLQQLCLETRVARSPYHRHVPCCFYRVDFDKLHDAIQSFLKQSESIEKEDAPPNDPAVSESVQTGLYSGYKRACTPGTSSLHYTKNYSIDLDTYIEGAPGDPGADVEGASRCLRDDVEGAPGPLSAYVEGAPGCLRADKENARTAKAKELLAAYRRVRYPTKPQFRESEFKMYRSALYALVDDHRSVDEIERATRAALERFSSRAMVNLNSIARHIEALLEENTYLKRPENVTQSARRHPGAPSISARRHPDAPSTGTYEESLQQQDDLIRRALGDQYDAYFQREKCDEES